MKRSTKLGMLSFGLGFASLAFAGQGSDQQLGDQQPLSFEDFKIACKEPQRFHNQVAPANIQITCKDMQLKWVSEAPGTFQLDNARHVTTALTSEKYNVSPATAELKALPQSEACPKFKQISETVSFSKAVACDEVANYQGSGADFCAGIIDSVRSSNPSSVQVQDTGKMLDLCSEAQDIVGRMPRD